MTDVDPQLYYDAAAAYREDSDGAAAALGALAAALTTVNAAGSHGVGPQWATAYDAAADQAAQVGQRLVNALHNIGSLLQQTGVNHDETEEATTMNQRDGDGDPAVPPGETAGTYLDNAPDLPSAAGGDEPTPIGWALVADRVTDGWPNGDSEKLWAAATAWKAYGDQLVAVNDMAGPEELNLLVSVDAAEIAQVADRMNSARVITTDVAGAAGDLYRACKAYGDKVERIQFFMTTVLFELAVLVGFRFRGGLGTVAKALNEANVALAAEHCNFLNERLRAAAVQTIADLETAKAGLDKGLANANGLLKLVPRKVNPTPTEVIRENRRKGARAEQRAGIDPHKKKTRIYPHRTDPDETKRKKYRIPDELDREQKTLREVKNVERLAMTDQLDDMAKWAKQEGYTMVIVIDRGRTQGGVALETELESKYDGLDVVIDDSKALS